MSDAGIMTVTVRLIAVRTREASGGRFLETLA
jgi:hypothetical protein